MRTWTYHLIILVLGLSIDTNIALAQNLQPVETFETEAQKRELEATLKQLRRTENRIKKALEELNTQAAARSVSGKPTPRIVNGLLTSTFYSTGALLKGSNAQSAKSWCSGTLIGCRTFLTAAHCVNRDKNPSHYKVFFQHGGVFDVADVRTRDDYAFPKADVAIIKLSKQVEGILPTPINNVSALSVETEGTIVGFGRSGGFNQDYGIKRVGQVRTAKCQAAFKNKNLICWNFNAPIGLPGENSNTCNADSGGPLFAELDAGTVVAGVTSGGSRSSCLQHDHSYDADVFHYRQWITTQTGNDTVGKACGLLNAAGTKGVSVLATSDVLNNETGGERYQLKVTGERRRLRVAMNGTDDGQADFNLYVKHGSPPNTQSYDCAQDGLGQYAFCEIDNPSSGDWYVFVDRKSGEGTFQVTATVYD